MSIKIFTLQIADPEVRSQIKRGIEQISSEFIGDWSLSVLSSPSNDSWEIKLKNPKGVQRVRTLSGSHQHTIQEVQKALRELQSSLAQE
jgi:hypothetical protein